MIRSLNVKYPLEGDLVELTEPVFLTAAKYCCGNIEKLPYFDG